MSSDFKKLQIGFIISQRSGTSPAGKSRALQFAYFILWNASKIHQSVMQKLKLSSLFVFYKSF